MKTLFLSQGCNVEDYLGFDVAFRATANCAAFISCVLTMLFYKELLLHLVGISSRLVAHKGFN